LVLSLFDKEEAHVHEGNKELDPGPQINRRLCALGDFFIFILFFSIYQKYTAIFFLKNVTQSPVHPTEGRYRRKVRTAVSIGGRWPGRWAGNLLPVETAVFEPYRRMIRQ